MEGVKRLKTIFSFINKSFDPTALDDEDLDLEYLGRLLNQIKNVDPEENFKQDVFSKVLGELGYPPVSAEARESEEIREERIDYKYEDAGVGFEVKPPLTAGRMRKKSYSVEDLKRYFEQVKGYIKKHGLEYVVLTDGISFLAFSKRSIRNSSQPYFTYFDFTKFEEELRDFNYPKVFDKLRRLEGQSQKEPLEKSFFNALQKWISLVETDVEDKNLAVHFINALIFVRTLEDVEAIDFNYLRNHYNIMKKDYPLAPKRAAEDFLNHIYRHIYYHYDTELFKQNTESFQKIIASIQYETLNALLEGIGGGAELVTCHLYNFNFALVNFDVLGHVYERYIAEDKKQKGIFYTPQWMVDIIVKRVLEPLAGRIIERAERLLESFSFKEAEDEFRKLFQLKILDPACGSGTFLVTAYNLLYKKVKEFIELFDKAVSKRNQRATANLLDDIRPKLGDWQEHLMFCLYGIDSDPCSIEVAKLNLWINLIKKEPKERYHYTRISERGASLALPDLSANLVIGDSLKTNNMEEQKKIFVDSSALLKLREDYYSAPASEKGRESLGQFFELSNNILSAKGLNDYTLYYLIFPEVFEAGGFDLVIGNPPYVGEEDNKELFRATKEFPLIKERGWYMSKMDYWYFFSHLALELLKDGGVHSFIVPTYWLKAYGSKNLINHFAAQGMFHEMWNFRGFRVFYTLENDKYRYVGVDSLVFFYQKGEGATEYQVKYFEMPQELLKEEREKVIEGLWETIADNAEESEIKIEDGKILILKAATSKIISQTQRLGSMFNVNQGIVAAHDKVGKKFLITKAKELGKTEDELRGELKVEPSDGIFVVTEIEKQKILGKKPNPSEKNIFKPFYFAHQLQPFYFDDSYNEWVIYISSSLNKEMQADTSCLPMVRKHLDRMREFITSDFKPYGLHRARKQEIFESEKIVSIRQSPHHPRFTYVDKPAYFDLSVNIITKKSGDSFSLKALVCILNSKFALDWFNTNCSKKGNTWQIDRGVLEGFPLVILSKREEKQLDALYDKAATLTKELKENEKRFIRVKENLGLTDIPLSELPKVARLLKLDESDFKADAFEGLYELGIINDVTLKVTGEKASSKLVFNNPLRLKNVEYSLRIFKKVFLIPHAHLNFLGEQRTLSEIRAGLGEVFERIEGLVKDLYSRKK